jgi:hypothetical protein
MRPISPGSLLISLEQNKDAYFLFAARCFYMGIFAFLEKKAGVFLHPGFKKATMEGNKKLFVVLKGTKISIAE